MREFALAVSLALLVLTVPSTAPQPPPGIVHWTAHVVQTNVTEGVPIYLIVTGPPNATTAVTLDGAPFGHTFPSYQRVWNMPNTSLLGKNGTLLNVTIPSTNLYVGPYLLTVQASNGSVVLAQTVHIVIGSNITALAAAIASLEVNETILSLRQTSLQNLQTAGTTHDQVYFWASLAEFVILLIVIVFTRTGAAEWRIGRRVRAAFDRAFWKPLDHVTEVVSTRYIPRPNPLRIFRGITHKSCLTCQIDSTEEEIREHYREPEPRGHGLPNPVRGRHYEVHDRTVKLAARRRVTNPPDLGRLRDVAETLVIE